MSNVFRMMVASVLLIGMLGCNRENRLVEPLTSFYNLASLQEGRGMRTSSSATDWANSNADARPIRPGQTLVLAELEGPGMIRHIWNTINSKEYGASRQIVLRMYWDGEKEPSVESPLGDFFGVGHGINVNVDSAVVRVSAEGLARNCYWDMPFRKSARITVTNEGRLPVEAFYYYIDWIKLSDLPEDTPYFHAMYRQEYPCTTGERYMVADIQGRGHYVGTVLSCRQHQRGWMGEGDDFFFIDGEKEPSLRGTGTEDYFSDAWGFRESRGLYYGVSVYEGMEIQDRTCVYRWHLSDPVPFSSSLKLEIEHWGWWPIVDEKGNDAIDAGERYDDWSTVGFWYQLEPHKTFEKTAYGSERLYYDWTNIIEAESLKDKIKVTSGSIDIWGGSHTSGHGFVHWGVDEVGHSLELPFNVEKTGKYKLVMLFLRQPHFGVFETQLDGEMLGRHLDLYHYDLSSREFALPAKELQAGEHVLSFKSVWKNPKSTGRYFGLDAILLVPVEND